MARALRPLFVTVTWGAGGSTAARSLELAEICQRQLGLTTCLHLTCTNMSRALIDEALDEAKVLGIRNILALRGDPPRTEEYLVDGQDEEEDSNKDFTWASDLVRYIREKHGDYFCVGVAGYPEGHSDESHPEHQDPAKDMPYLVEKVQAGADFVMTQLTYDVGAYQRYEKMLREHESGLFKTMPIIPGLMPIQSYQILKRVTNLSHAAIPADILARVEAARTDDEAVKQVGVDILSEIVEKIKETPCPGPRGLHFYTLNLEKSVAFILERCNLIRDDDPEDDDTLNDFAVVISPPNGDDDPSLIKKFRRRASSINSGPHNRIIVDRPRSSQAGDSSSVTSGAATHETSAFTAAAPALNPPDRNTTLQISEGLGSLGREATWDDFPNGRWGDARSPAFGEIDGYGPSLHVSTTTARKLWGTPTSRKDISTIFRRHLTGDLNRIPWSEGGTTDGEDASPSGLNPETETIKDELLHLIDGRGWWTLASQPAVNGVRSDDPTFGWGPIGEGFVFQKAFVEFFCPEEDYQNILKPLFRKHADELMWFSVNHEGDFEEASSLSEVVTNGTDGHATTTPTPAETSLPPPASTVNAVTWGVFRNKEIITPTIIEEVSFRAWGEEAFSIWAEWRRCFSRGSESEKLLEQVRRGSRLVVVVGTAFRGNGKGKGKGEGGRLWAILGGEDL